MIRVWRTRVFACANPANISQALARRATMAKGQLRGNKEAKKPKKSKDVVVPAGSFLVPPKSGKPAKPQR
jgi:hypothetical protein